MRDETAEFGDDAFEQREVGTPADVGAACDEDVAVADGARLLQVQRYAHRAAHHAPVHRRSAHHQTVTNNRLVSIRKS